MAYNIDWNGDIVVAKDRSYKGTPCLSCGVEVRGGGVLCGEHQNFKTGGSELKGGEWVRDANGVMRWMK